MTTHPAVIDGSRKTLVVFRHGQTDWNLQGRCQGGENDVPLNDTGRGQAHGLAEKIRGYAFDRIFSSPLSRALETAQIVQQAAQAEVEIVPGLVELIYGDAAGRPSVEVKSLYADVYRDWFGKSLAEAPDAGFPQGETRADFVRRVFSVFDDIAAQDFRLAGVATHSGVIWNFVEQIGGPSLGKVDFCEGHVIEIDAGAGFSYKGVL